MRSSTIKSSVISYILLSVNLLPFNSRKRCFNIGYGLTMTSSIIASILNLDGDYVCSTSILTILLDFLGVP